jgi:protein-L-isoaspartate(D-aspartate) O-methyltransferase
LDAFKKIERKKFISKEFHMHAYEDSPLPIGAGQTISQPHTIAFMLDLLELKDNQKILEVGSGSGYVLALISKISKNSQIYGIERIKGLADKSKRALKNEKNIEIIHGDGSRGLPKASPLDRILTSAAADELPQKLIKQLKIGGILVAPVRNSIVYLKKTKTKNKILEFPGFRFVPLIED